MQAGQATGNSRECVSHPRCDTEQLEGLIASVIKVCRRQQPAFTGILCVSLRTPPSMQTPSALAVWWQMKYAQNSWAALVTPWHHALEVFSDCQPSSLCFFDLVCTAGLQAALAAGCQHLPAAPTAPAAAGTGLTGRLINPLNSRNKPCSLVQDAGNLLALTTAQRSEKHRQHNHNGARFTHRR